jgi:hypothetical protein
MARSLAAAIAAVEGPKFDAIVYSPPPRRAAPTPEPIQRAFEGLDYSPIRAIARWLASRYRCPEAVAEDATHDALEQLLSKRPDVFDRGREGWLRILAGAARFRLFDIRTSAMFVESLDHLTEVFGDAGLRGMQAPTALDLDAVTDARGVPPPNPREEWSDDQIIGALQRFHNDFGRPPKTRECKALHGLPSPATVRKRFGSFAKALQAAGMTPPTLGLRRKRWSAVEAARACLSFRKRNGRWPDEIDLLRNRGVLPSRSVMIRFFGSTRPAEVQQGVESILGLST